MESCGVGLVTVSTVTAFTSYKCWCWRITAGISTEHLIYPTLFVTFSYVLLYLDIDVWLWPDWKKTYPKPILTAGSIVSSCKVISHLNNFHNAPKTIKSKKLSPFTPFHGSWYTANHKFYCMLYVKNLMCHLQFLQFWLDSFCERQKYQSKCLTATVNGTSSFNSYYLFLPNNDILNMTNLYHTVVFKD